MSTTESDVMRSKLRNDFDTVDINGNGYITSADLDGFVDRIVGAFGYAPGSAEHMAFAAANQPWRDAMQSALEKDADHQISFEEYVTFWTNASDEQAMQIVDPWIDGLFSLTDDNDDEKLSKAEFLAYCNALGFSADEMDRVFEALDTDSSGYLTREEFGRYMTDAVTSTDANAPGNALYLGVA